MAGSSFKPVERTFYAPLLRLMENLGFVGVSEAKLSDDGSYIDILFTYSENTYVLEVKIGEGNREFLKAIVQAYEYGIKKGTNNIIVIRYPLDVGKPRNIGQMDRINEIAVDRTVESIFLTKSWYEYVELSPKDSLTNLKAKIDNKLLATENIEHASHILRISIRILSKMLTKYYTKDDLKSLFDYLTKDFGLFKGLSSSKKKLDNQIIDLLCYILVNQIIFFFLYSKRKPESLTENARSMKKLRSLDDLEKYFVEIRNINFKPIFDIQVIKKIPSDAQILDVINDIIQCLSPLRIEDIKHDLFGRLIGHSLPEDTRKILASYYTRVNSAELLAQLGINKGNEKVWDLACGSGTILLSAYNRKMELCTPDKGLTKQEIRELHKRFLEEELTGTDIMPFACHLSGLTLSAQNLDVPTDFIRIANKNSLELYALPMEVKEAYGDISSAIERIRKSQKTLSFYLGQEKKEGPSAPSKSFQLTKVDTVLINPPFTRASRIPPILKKDFQKEELLKISGKRVSLWGSFLALADKVITNGGTIGAIIPLNFLRGRYSFKIRQYFLENYSFEYMIRPAYNSYFSEGTDYTDLIIIAKKIVCEAHHEVKMVTLHKPIGVNTLSDIRVITNDMRSSYKDQNNSDLSLRIVKQIDLTNNIENLMPFMYTDNSANQTKIEVLVSRLFASNNIGKLDERKVKDGFQKLRPRGESKKLIITNSYSNSRLERANLRFKGDTDGIILNYNDKNGKESTINKSDLTKTLRTVTGINRFDMNGLHDYIIGHPTAPPENTHLIIANRLRLNSDNTFMMAVYSEEKIKPTNAFFMYLCSSEEAKMLCLFMNSIFYLTQFVRLSKQSTSDYMEIKQLDLKQMCFPDMGKLTNAERQELLKYFDENRGIQASSILGQLKAKEKMPLDQIWARVLNIPVSSKELEDAYESLVLELEHK